MKIFYFKKKKREKKARENLALWATVGRTRELEVDRGQVQRPLCLPTLLRQNHRWVQKGARETSRREVPLHSARCQISHGSRRAAWVERSGERAKPEVWQAGVWVWTCWQGWAQQSPGVKPRSCRPQGTLFLDTKDQSLWTAAQRPPRSVRICHSTEDAVQGSQPVAETGGQHVNLRRPPRHDTIPAHLPLPSPTQPDQSPYPKETGFSERKDVTQRRPRNTVRREFVRRVGAVTEKLKRARIWVVARARLWPHFVKREHQGVRPHRARRAGGKSLDWIWLAGGSHRMFWSGK